MVGGRDRPGRSRPTDPLCMIKNGAHRAAIRVLAFRSLNISLLASCCLLLAANRRQLQTRLSRCWLQVSPLLRC